MKFIYLSIVFLFVINDHPSYGQPSSNFTVGAEGWQALTEGPGLNPVDGWMNINGNPGGCYKATDNSNGTWYFFSPAEFNTDLSGYYGSYLSFDLKQNISTLQTNLPDVIICKADGSKIVYSTPLNPGTSWTTYLVPLSETGWKYTTLLGAAVTAADMISFLSNICYIKIRGDYSSNMTETCWLDNVSIDPAILLPIELVSFNGNEIQPGVAQLSWELASSTDCQYFQIEKCVGNSLQFDSVGIVTVNENASGEYQFSDDHFTSNAYYRLRMVDLLGKATVSEMILIEATQTKAELKIYPNPSSGLITVNNINGSDLTGTITCTDMMGHIVPFQPFGGANTLQLDLSDMPAGIYYLHYLNNNISTAYNFEVVH